MTFKHTHTVPQLVPHSLACKNLVRTSTHVTPRNMGRSKVVTSVKQIQKDKI